MGGHALPCPSDFQPSQSVRECTRPAAGGCWLLPDENLCLHKTHRAHAAGWASITAVLTPDQGVQLCLPKDLRHGGICPLTLAPPRLPARCSCLPRPGCSAAPAAPQGSQRRPRGGPGAPTAGPPAPAPPGPPQQCLALQHDPNPFRPVNQLVCLLPHCQGPLSSVWPCSMTPSHSGQPISWSACSRTARAPSAVSGPAA